MQQPADNDWKIGLAALAVYVSACSIPAILFVPGLLKVYAFVAASATLALTTIGFARWLNRRDDPRRSKQPSDPAPNPGGPPESN